MHRFVLVFIFVITAFTASAAEKFLVFAAASVTDLMEEILKEYNRANSTEIAGSYAASGALARQIMDDAPAAIFISADPKWTDELAAKNLIDKASLKDYLGNILVLIAPVDSKLSYDFASGKKLSSLLKKGDKFAIGDPEYVPAGSYAKASLTSLGQWADLEKSFVRAENVRVVLSFVSRGEAALGAVYGSDASLSKDVKVLAEFPAGSYPKVSYPIAIIAKNKTPEVEKFYKYLLSAEVKPIIKRYGFSVE
ncbi:MAG: molybdate ABC transporter substrate-binding protein [Deferribacteraceae bacterium]|jgi:molybdate transport system substrate-binding protein|nr:molybdate ABC transporter substrate-binding protein [Deferribacteraceae bacterium]